MIYNSHGDVLTQQKILCCVKKIGPDYSWWAYTESGDPVVMHRGYTVIIDGPNHDVWYHELHNYLEGYECRRE